jgi:predicted transcriptional regulator
MATPLFSIRLNLALKARLTAIAEQQGRSLSYVIDKALTEFADKTEAAAKRRAREID